MGKIRFYLCMENLIFFFTSKSILFFCYYYYYRDRLASICCMVWYVCSMNNEASIQF